MLHMKLFDVCFSLFSMCVCYSVEYETIQVYYFLLSWCGFVCLSH